MAQILIINLHSSRNAGDAALALTAAQQLHRAFPSSKVILSMNDPASHPDGDPKVGSFMHWIHTLSVDGKPRWHVGELIRLGAGSIIAVISYRWFKHPRFPFLSLEQKAFLQAYFVSDLVISAPGNFLYSSGKVGLSFLMAIYSMAYALWAGKPLYLLPQSIGPLKRSWERRLLRWVLNPARLILLREEISVQEIRRAGVNNQHIYLHPDIAFSFPTAPSAEAVQWLKQYGVDIEHDTPLLGITAINWGAQTGKHVLQSQYESALAAAARFFIDTMGGKVVFFPQVTGVGPYADDRLPAYRVIASLPEKKARLAMIDQPPSPALLKAAYGLMDVFIGTRMHSNIFALSSSVPVLAIAYRHKTQGIMQMLGLDDWCLDIRDVDGKGLVDRFAALWEHRQEVRSLIQQKMAPVIESSSRAGDIIAEDYAKGFNA